MDSKVRRTFITTLVAVTLILFSFFGLVFTGVIDLNGSKNNTPTGNIVPDISVDEDKLALKQLWQDNHKINNDYVGQLFFDSGLINVPFVQAKDVYNANGELYKFYTESGSVVSDPTGYTGNDVYIWTYWATGEYDYNNNGGSVFMDYRNELYDENLIIYGHHFSFWNDATRKKAFTPIEQLLEFKNYEENKYLTLALENEIRKYELAVVYQYDDTDDYYFKNCQYWRTNYNYDDFEDVVDRSYYENYIKAIKEHQLYDTGVELTTNNKTLTLQTCISGHTGELFQILVFKEISVQPYVS